MLVLGRHEGRSVSIDETIVTVERVHRAALRVVHPVPKRLE